MAGEGWGSSVERAQKSGWGGLWALPLIFGGTLGRPLSFSGPQFFHLKCGKVGLNQWLFSLEMGFVLGFGGKL